MCFYGTCPQCIRSFVSTVLLQVYTEYHYVLLHADKLAALNQVSGKLVHDVPFTHGLSTSVVGEFKTVLIAHEAGQVCHALDVMFKMLVLCRAEIEWRTQHLTTWNVGSLLQP